MHLNNKEPCIHSGEVVDISFWASIYISNLDSTAQFFVNNRPVAIAKGIGNYSIRYQKPGLKKVELKALIPNPLTHEYRSYSRELTIPVCK